eukprot:gene28744-31923_t
MASFDDYEYLERQLDAAPAAAPDEAGGVEKKEKSRRRSRSRDRKSRDRKSSRSKSRDKRKSSRRSRSRSKGREVRDRDHRGHRDDRPQRDFRDDRRDRYVAPPRRERTPPEERLLQEKERELKELERATRTVFAMQLNIKAEEMDIFKFFSQAGKVLDIKLITDKITRKSKGMAYIEYATQEDVFRAMQLLPGQPLMGQPVQVKASEMEKNLAWEAAQAAKQSVANNDAVSNMLLGLGGVAPAGMGVCRLQVENLHPDVDDVDLKGVFEVFGFLELINVVKDSSGRSLGCGFAQYRDYNDGVKAMQHWNGKVLAGRELKVSIAEQPAPVPTLLPPMLAPELMGYGADPATVAAAMAAQQQMLAYGGQTAVMGPGGFPMPPGMGGPPLAVPGEDGNDDVDDEARGGLRLNAQSRAALMQRLAANAGLESKPAMVMMMQHPPPAAPVPQVPQVSSGLLLDQGLLGPPSPIPTQCILLKNMFDPNDPDNLGDPEWASEVESDVKEECSRFGEVSHIFIDKNSQGFVYLKFTNVQAAEMAHKTLHLRWYSGKQSTRTPSSAHKLACIFILEAMLSYNPIETSLRTKDFGAPAFLWKGRQVEKLRGTRCPVADQQVEDHWDMLYISVLILLQDYHADEGHRPSCFPPSVALWRNRSTACVLMERCEQVVELLHDSPHAGPDTWTGLPSCRPRVADPLVQAWMRRQHFSVQARTLGMNTLMQDWRCEQISPCRAGDVYGTPHAGCELWTTLLSRPGQRAELCLRIEIPHAGLELRTEFLRAGL